MAARLAALKVSKQGLIHSSNYSYDGSDNISIYLTFYFDFLIINFKLFLSAMRSLSWRERNVTGLTQASCVLN